MEAQMYRLLIRHGTRWMTIGVISIFAVCGFPAIAVACEGYSYELKETEANLAEVIITSMPSGMTIHTVKPLPGPNPVVGVSCVGKTTPCKMFFEVPPSIISVEVN
jgi:hypothetical protein